MPKTDLGNDTTGDAQVESLRTTRVPLGILLVYYGLALFVLVNVVGVSWPVIDPRGHRMLFVYATAVIPFLFIVASVLSLVGTSLCLTAPIEMPGKGALYVGCVLNAAALFINVAYHFMALPFVIAVSSGLHSTVGFVCFLIFLKHVGGFLRNSELTSKALGLRNLGIALVLVTVLWIVPAIVPMTPLARFVPVKPFSAVPLFGLLWISLGIVVVFRYARLLRDLKQAVARD